MPAQFDEIALDIAQRQYFMEGETSVADMFRRVTDTVYPYDDPRARNIYDDMINKRFCPGGRILAGAGTEHGNLLNCFVQDGSPHEPGTDDYALALARKLAIVTKVGGGNGLNLDSFPPKTLAPERVGRAYLDVNPDHPDFHDVRSGTFLNLVTGEREERGYHTVEVYPPAKELYEITVPDSVEGIWDAAAVMVRMLLRGEDVFVNLDALRPEGNRVKGSGGTSSGPSSFAVEVFDNFARWASLGGASTAGPVATLRYLFAPTLRVIRQGGVRRGAGMATLSATHPDLEDFISAKDLDRERDEGDISTFNISVLASDEFMREKGERLEAIAAQAWRTGEPGLLFVDTINKHNMLSEANGPIVATNPCGEIGLYPGEPCDLGALNIAAFVEDGVFLADEFALAVRRALHFLDTVLDVENPPTEEIAEAIKRNRRIGLGMMGLSDALIKLGHPYDSIQARQFAIKIAKIMADVAMFFTELHGAGPSSGPMTVNMLRRNVALLTVAPTGTTAMLFGVTSGIEPLFAPFIYRRIGTEYKQILHPLFKEMLSERTPTPLYCTWKPIQATSNEGTPFTAYQPNEWDWQKVTQAISDNHGSVQGLEHIPQDIRTLFVCAHDIRPIHHVAMQSAVQMGFDLGFSGEPTYVGNSISKTINFGNDVSPLDIQHVMEDAHFMQCKGITVYRDGSRDFQVLNTSLSEDDGSDVRSQQADQLDEIVAATCELGGSCDV